MLPTYIKENYSEVNAIVLAVKNENKHAQRIYLNNGYADEGKHMMEVVAN